MLCTVFGGISHDGPKYNHWARSAQHMRAVCVRMCVWRGGHDEGDSGSRSADTRTTAGRQTTVTCHTTQHVPGVTQRVQ